MVKLESDVCVDADMEEVKKAIALSIPGVV